MKKRRYFKCPGELLVMLSMGDISGLEMLSDPLPHDTRVVGILPHDDLTVTILIESESFDPIMEGTPYPEQPPIAFKTIPRGV